MATQRGIGVAAWVPLAPLASQGPLARSAPLAPPAWAGAASVPGTPLGPQAKPSATEQAERDQIAAKLAEVAGLSSAGLALRDPYTFASSLSYDPASAQNLAQIQGSTLGLTGVEMQVLDKSGFVISNRQRFQTFTHGYQAIYAADLPLFVSADPILVCRPPQLRSHAGGRRDLRACPCPDVPAERHA